MQSLHQGGGAVMPGGFSPASLLYSGVFADEKVLQALHILQTLSDHCFSKLHEVANEGRPSSSEYASRFRKGLDSINYWRTDVKMAETNYAISRFPELGVLYKYTIVRYLKELYKNENTGKIPVTIPPLHDFIHSYYLALANTSYMQKLEFLNVYGLERTHMHMEALRTVLIDVTRSSLYTPASSLYEPVTYDPTNIHGLVSVERDITPWDSVSQRGGKEKERTRDNHRSSQHTSHNGHNGHGRRSHSRDSRESRESQKSRSSHGSKGSKGSYGSKRPQSAFDKETQRYMKTESGELKQPIGGGGSGGNIVQNSLQQLETLGDMNSGDPNVQTSISKPNHLNIQIEKEPEAEQDNRSESSEDSDSSLEFHSKPKFPGNSGKRSSVVSAASTSSRSTLPLNVPPRNQSSSSGLPQISPPFEVKNTRGVALEGSAAVPLQNESREVSYTIPKRSFNPNMLRRNNQS